MSKFPLSSSQNRVTWTVFEGIEIKIFPMIVVIFHRNKPSLWKPEQHIQRSLSIDNYSYLSENSIKYRWFSKIGSELKLKNKKQLNIEYHIHL